MPSALDPTQAVVAAWRTTNRATTYLVEHVPADIWARPVPELPKLTVRSVAAHVHNSRCRWIKALGARHGIKAPRVVDARRVGPAGLARALAQSSEGLVKLIELGAARGGKVPRAVWQNFPSDLPHFLGYFTAHEAHHRGQIFLIARLLGRRLPREVMGGVWQWTRFAREKS